jgi:NADH dehydrogenase
MINIPKSNKKRVVIAGCGFARITLARKLKNSGYQIVIMGKHNFHQFPPLFYQVASAGLEASSIRPLANPYKGWYHHWPYLTV